MWRKLKAIVLEVEELHALLHVVIAMGCEDSNDRVGAHRIERLGVERDDSLQSVRGEDFFLQFHVILGFAHHG